MLYRSRYLLFGIICLCFKISLFSQQSDTLPAFLIPESIHDSITLQKLLNDRTYGQYLQYELDQKQFDDYVNIIDYERDDDENDSTYISEDEENNLAANDSTLNSILFSYCEGMPGYGLYQTFDSSRVHYNGTNCTVTSPVTLQLTESGEYCHPAKYRVTSNYGPRRNRFHYGIDIGYSTGTPVTAAFDGVVRISKYSTGGYGNVIVIRHHNNLETLYAHLSKTLVEPGQIVSAGDTIGLGGNTGRSYGSHLHFEVRYLGRAFDPRKIINFETYKLLSDTLVVSEALFKKPRTSGTYVSKGKVYYKVKKGDSLSLIASRNRTTVDRLKKLNNLKGNMIKIGQTIRVK